jgi:hypothetical protein
MKRSFTLIQFKINRPVHPVEHKRFDNWSDAISMLASADDGSVLIDNDAKDGEIEIYRKYGWDFKIFSVKGRSDINIPILLGQEEFVRWGTCPIRDVTEEHDGISITISGERIWRTFQDALKVLLDAMMVIEREAS